MLRQVHFSLLSSFIGLALSISLPTTTQAQSIRVDDNVGQVELGRDSEASGGFSTAIGTSTKATADESTAIGLSAEATGTGSLAFGSRAKSSGVRSNAVGVEANASGQDSIAFGSRASTHALNSVAVGLNAEAFDVQDVAIGTSAKASGGLSTAIGSSANAAGSSAQAFGSGASAAGSDSIAIGTLSDARGHASIAMGSQARTLADQCVALGSGSVCDESQTVSVGNQATRRRLVNVRGGISDNDAANVGQVRSVARIFGAGADMVNGVIVEPWFEFRGGASFTNVAEAMYYLDGRVTDLTQNPGTGPSTPGPQGPQGPAGQDGVGGGSTVSAGKNIDVVENGDGTQTVGVSDTISLSDEGAIKVAKAMLNGQGLTVEGGASVTTAGVNAGNQRVTGVAPGRIEQGSTDAVNGGQVWDMQQANNDRWTETNRRVDRQDKRIDGMGAQLGAMTQAAVAAAQNGGAAVGQVNFNAGVGFSGNAAAMSLGWGARLSERVSVSAGISFGSSNKPVAGMGISINMGR